ncbi:MAG: hypothetical protein ICV74_11680 [Thermoleophilia bacterium]|nr:hypothetical protein [Thermoleophilia bacterium]
MKRLVIVAALREGAEGQAADLLERGAPFTPGETALDRHAVYAAPGSVVFVFEGPDVEATVDDLASDFLQPRVRDAIEEWTPLLAGEPRVARELFFWQRSDP